MTHLYDSYDREYLTELMGYFPVPSPVSLDGAFEQIQDFCNHQFRAEEIAEALRGTSEDDFYKFFQMIPLELHSQLFENILSNAGKYRNGNDPNNGEVFFGPPANTYAGADPVAIESKVKKCLSTLILFPADPVRIAATFYQRFVKIHPFYDGNGRVARFIVEV
ncbi:MAG: Fic family protein [Candidatus Electrothrix sp. GM3_4]|nr:Fic family protein [Candidatus Electrothrix sp. GM3_4]